MAVEIKATTGTPALSGFILYADSAESTFKKAPLSAVKTTLALVKADVGLSNVDNTSDANKPVSTAQAAADAAVLASANSTSAAASHITSGTLDGDRLPAMSTTKKGAVPATGTPSGKYLKDDGTWATVAGGSGAWGGITGDLEDQTDLQAALDDKAAIPEEQTLTDAATVVWDYELGEFAKVTLGGNRTLSLTNAIAPASGVLQVIQDGTGSRTLTLPGNTPTGLSLSTGAGETDILGFVKYATGIFWSIDNYGATVLPPTPLNAPTGLTAGTPTADGVPFTWTDTNTSPAESSSLIQIAADADTTFTTIIATRTPAANATSEPAGTGLSASTAYRARIKAVGDGVTTSDSAYSSAATFTTAAASSFLTFGHQLSGFTYSGVDGSLTGAPGSLALSDQTFITGEGFKGQWNCPAMNMEMIVGFNITDPLVAFADMRGFAAWSTPSGQMYGINAVGGISSAPYPWADQDWFKIEYDGTNVICSQSPDDITYTPNWSVAIAPGTLRAAIIANSPGVGTASVKNLQRI